MGRLKRVEVPTNRAYGVWVRRAEEVRAAFKEGKAAEIPLDGATERTARSSLSAHFLKSEFSLHMMENGHGSVIAWLTPRRTPPTVKKKAQP